MSLLYSRRHGWQVPQDEPCKSTNHQIWDQIPIWKGHSMCSWGAIQCWNNEVFPPDWKPQDSTWHIYQLCFYTLLVLFCKLFHSPSCLLESLRLISRRTGVSWTGFTIDSRSILKVLPLETAVCLTSNMNLCLGALLLVHTIVDCWGFAKKISVKMIIGRVILRIWHQFCSCWSHILQVKDCAIIVVFPIQ